MEEHRNDAKRPDEVTDQRNRDEDARGAGDILGISRTSGGDDTPEQPTTDQGSPRRDDETRRSHVGARDVTEGTTGGTTPDTGGSGVFRRGSGATGTDIGR